MEQWKRRIPGFFCRLIWIHPTPLSGVETSTYLLYTESGKTKSERKGAVTDDGRGEEGPKEDDSKNSFFMHVFWFFLYVHLPSR